jgi:hypothetical protein
VDLEAFMCIPRCPSVQDREKLRLTAGIPSPDAIDNQKSAYSKKLDQQLRYEEELLKMNQRKKKELIKEAAEAQKRQACMKIEQQAMEQEHHLDQQCLSQVMGMKKELETWKLVLEKQASEATFGYNNMKSQEEILMAQFDAHQRALEASAATASQKNKEQAGKVPQQNGQQALPAQMSPAFLPPTAITTMLPTSSFRVPPTPPTPVRPLR